jgi:hypothetical protein
MNNINEIDRIIAKHTAGKATLAETNADLKQLGVDLRLDPKKNEIKPGEAGRYGLLDTGTGTLDKVEIRDGKLVGNNVGVMYALCIFNSKVYHVKGDTLTE